MHLEKRTRKASMLAVTLATFVVTGVAWAGRAEAQRTPPTDAHAATSQAQQSVTVRDFSYAPNAFSTRAGEVLMVTISNTGPSSHTFTINGAADTGAIPSGQSRTVQFTPMTAGTLTFYCTIHGQKVMSGQISVTAAAAQPAQPQQPAAPPAQQPAPPPPRPQVIMQPPSTGDGGLLE